MLIMTWQTKMLYMATWRIPLYTRLVWRLILRSNHVCAADKSNTGKDTCQNDSGGPMFLSENGRFVQCRYIEKQKYLLWTYTKLSISFFLETLLWVWPVLGLAAVTQTTLGFTRECPRWRPGSRKLPLEPRILIVSQQIAPAHRDPWVSRI